MQIHLPRSNSPFASRQPEALLMDAKLELDLIPDGKSNGHGEGMVAVSRLQQCTVNYQSYPT